MIKKTQRTKKNPRLRMASYILEMVPSQMYVPEKLIAPDYKMSKHFIKKIISIEGKDHWLQNSTDNFVQSSIIIRQCPTLWKWPMLSPFWEFALNQFLTSCVSIITVVKYRHLVICGKLLGSLFTRTPQYQNPPNHFSAMWKNRRLLR